MTRTLAACCCGLVLLLVPVLVSGQEFTPVNVDLDVDTGKLEKALAQPISFDFKDAKLAYVLREFSFDVGITISLDEKSLTDAGLSGDVPVRMNSPLVRFESALNFMLDQLDLTWMPGHGGIVITTPEGVGVNTRIYPVYDLVRAKLRGKTVADYDSLIEVITSTVESDSWEENGGNGAIEPYNGSLVISQSWTVHRKIEHALGAIRAAHSQAPSDWENEINEVFARQLGTKKKPGAQSTYMFPIEASAIGVGH